MTTHPLTHHEIFTLVEPFSRRGYHVDLAASDRVARRLAFKPIARLSRAHPPQHYVETLALEQPGEARCRIVRTLRHASGLEASLESEGQDADQLLDLIESVDPEQHFRCTPKSIITRSYRLQTRSPVTPPAPAQPVSQPNLSEGTGAPLPMPTTGSSPESSSGDQAPQGEPSERATQAERSPRGLTPPAPTPNQRPRPQLILIRAEAKVEGLTLFLKAGGKRNEPAEIELRSDAGDISDLPEDLLAVIGWDWRLLKSVKQGWRSTLRLRGKEPTRSRDAEVKLSRTIAHLADTLQAPPSRYHERFPRARWIVTFRRAIPLLIGLGLILAAPAVQFLELPDESLIRMLIFHSPPILMIVLFSMRELPRIEIPPFPKPLTASSWRVIAADAIAPPIHEEATRTPQDAR